jgi:hypothetical protein
MKNNFTLPPTPDKWEQPNEIAEPDYKTLL